MIFGIGADVVELARIRAAFERHGERFAQRILGPRELATYAARTRRSPQRGMTYLATRFAAKEAISKALGLGMRMPMTWRAAQIVNAPSGRPEVVTSGELSAFVARHRLRLHVTVSDLDTLAIAHAVAEVIADGAGERHGV
jgi:holo-[acyl-carrier protein] synthase